MGRYTGPKDRLSRREGFDLFNAGTKLTRLNVTPGIHGPKGQLRAPSQYGRQLREKQKVKRMYGLVEKQFKKYVTTALWSEGKTGDTLFRLLESRLDNVLYRLGFASSRPQARQLVGHGHVFLNGKRVNIPSYQVNPGDSISLSNKVAEIASVKKLLEDENQTIPAWLERKGPAGKVKRAPNRDDVKEPVSEQDIVEFYSR
jgi:small subunit ribosomal protein S4